MNVMREIRIEKLTLNIGVGKNPALLDKGIMLLKQLTGRNPSKSITQKRIATWGIRPGLAIGCKVTIRGKSIKDLLTRFIQSNDDILPERNFDNSGNISFGIHEYINIPGVDYNPDIGIIGLQVCITLGRPGFRIKRRKNQKKKINKKHTISKAEAIEFMQKNYNINLGEQE